VSARIPQAAWTCIVLGGCGHPAPARETADSVPQDIVCDEQWPIIIVGGGPSGMAVASEVDGALLLEATASLGGRYGLASEFLVGTEAQLAAGFEDSPELAAADWPALTGSEATADTLAFFEGTRLVADRWQDMGFTLLLDTLTVPLVLDHPRLHFLAGEARSPQEALAESVRPGNEVRLSTAAESVLVREGRAAAVVAAGSTLCSDIVVVATGGYAANLEILASVAGTPEGAWAGARDTVQPTGQAITWARAGGWGTAALEDVGWFRRSLGVPGDDGRPIEPVIGDVVPWFWTGTDGARFVNETLITSVALSTPYRTHAPVWGFAPRSILEATLPDPADHEAFGAAAIAGERVVCGTDPGSLATAVGVDPLGLAATLAEVAVLAATRTTDVFGRAGQTFPPFDGGEICAFLPGQVASKTYGGVSVDEHGQALDTAGAPIEGLFVVGEAAGMAAPHLGGRSGFDGSVSAVLWSGWRTGAWIADRVAGDEPFPYDPR
jgi:hypothetical protein